MIADPKERAFEYCLEKMLEGARLEEVLDFYPEWAEELRHTDLVLHHFLETVDRTTEEDSS